MPKKSKKVKRTPVKKAVEIPELEVEAVPEPDRICPFCGAEKMGDMVFQWDLDAECSGEECFLLPSCCPEPETIELPPDFFHVPDSDAKGHAMIFHGPLAAANAAEYGYKRRGKKNVIPFDYYHITNAGKQFRSWDDVRAELNKIWPEAAQEIKEMAQELRGSMPQAKSRKRKRKWSEDEGEVDVDRLMQNRDDYYEGHKREVANATIGNIALLCNLDWNCSPKDIFWRGAATAAVADILEEDGYIVEIWSWTSGYNVYKRPLHGQFTGVRIKAAGEPLDVVAVAHAISGWFMLLGIFGSFASIPEYESLGSLDHNLKKWMKHMDIDTENVTVLEIPIVTDRFAAIVVTREAMNKVIDTQEGG